VNADHEIQVGCPIRSFNDAGIFPVDQNLFGEKVRAVLSLIKLDAGVGKQFVKGDGRLLRQRMGTMQVNIGIAFDKRMIREQRFLQKLV
jgi:hypothetical protein